MNPGISAQDLVARLEPVVEMRGHCRRMLRRAVASGLVVLLRDPRTLRSVSLVWLPAHVAAGRPQRHAFGLWVPSLRSPQNGSIEPGGLDCLMAEAAVAVMTEPRLAAVRDAALPVLGLGGAAAFAHSCRQWPEATLRVLRRIRDTGAGTGTDGAG